MPVSTAQSGIGGMCWDDRDGSCVVVYNLVCMHVVRLLVDMVCGQCVCVCVRVCVLCACVCVCVRACVHMCMRVCVRACVCGKCLCRCVWCVLCGVCCVCGQVCVLCEAVHGPPCPDKARELFKERVNQVAYIKADNQVRVEGVGE